MKTKDTQIEEVDLKNRDYQERIQVILMVFSFMRYRQSVLFAKVNLLLFTFVLRLSRVWNLIRRKEKISMCIFKKKTVRSVSDSAYCKNPEKVNGLIFFD